MGGLGGAFAPSNQRLSRLPWSLREVCVLLGGVLNSIPSLKNTHHHALAGSSHRLNMGCALAPVAVSLPLPSLPQLGRGGDMTVAVVSPHHPPQVGLAAFCHITQRHLPVLRFSTGEI